MALIISEAELAQLAKEFGPNLSEDVGYILRRGEAVTQGLGNTKPVTQKFGPYGIRVIYVGNMTVREKQEAGQLATSGDYILSAPAGLVLFTSDVWQITGQTWGANKRIISGRKAVPTNLNTNLVFIAKNKGTTGAIEPNWLDYKKPGQSVLDGDVLWTCAGPAPEYQIIQLASPSTYGDFFSVKMSCTLRQNVSGK